MIYILAVADLVLMIAIGFMYWKLNNQNKELSDRLTKENSGFKEALTKENSDFKEALTRENSDFKDALTKENSGFKEALTRENSDFKDALTKENQKELAIQKRTLQEQMYLHESELVQEFGEWCLKHKDEKKYFSPGRIKSVESHPTEKTTVKTQFQYNGDEVVCVTEENGVVISEMTYTKLGGIKSGKLFRDGVMREFHYDEFGQLKQERPN